MGCSSLATKCCKQHSSVGMSCVKEGLSVFHRKRKACLWGKSRGWSQRGGWECPSNWTGRARSENCFKIESQICEEQRQPKRSWFEASDVQSDQLPKSQLQKGLSMHHILHYSDLNSVLIASADYLRDRKKISPRTHLEKLSLTCFAVSLGHATVYSLLQSFY